MVAACRGVSAPSPPASKPISAHVLVVEEGVEDAHRVRAAADAGDDRVRKAPGEVEHLLARLLADDLLQVADHGRERMRSRDRPEDVVGVLDVGDPVAHRVVDRVLERAGAGRDGDDLGAEEAHPGDVERLALGVDLAHVDGALEAEEGGGGRGGDAVLTGPGLGDHARLADALREDGLAEHVVDLVGAGVVEVFALQDDAGTARVLGEPRHLGDDRRTPRVGAVQLVEFGVERRVGLRLVPGRGQLVERGDQGFGDEPSAEVAEVRALLRAEGIVGRRDIRPPGILRAWRPGRS